MNNLPYELIEMVVSFIPIMKRMIIILATMEYDEEDKILWIFRDNPYEQVMEKNRRNPAVFYMICELIKMAPMITYLKYKGDIYGSRPSDSKEYYQEWKNMSVIEREKYITFLNVHPFLTTHEIERQIHARESSVYKIITCYMVCDVIPDYIKYSSNQEKWTCFGPLYNLLAFKEKKEMKRKWD